MRWQCARGMAVWEGGSASGARGCQGGGAARGRGRSCDGGIGERRRDEGREGESAM